MMRKAAAASIRGLHAFILLVASIVWNLGFVYRHIGQDHLYIQTTNNNDVALNQPRKQSKSQNQKDQIISNDERIEWIDDIDTNRRLLCDLSKCGFKSKRWTGQGYYVVQNNNNNNKTFFLSMQQEWILSNEFASQFQIKHLLLDSPKEYNISEDFALRLNNNNNNNNNNNSKYRPDHPGDIGTVVEEEKEEIVTYESTDIRQNKIIVQPVQFMSSTSSIHYMCAEEEDDDIKSFRYRLDEMNVPLSSSKNYTQYREQLIQDMTSTIDMVVSPQKSSYCMVEDMRVIFDLRQGRIYHLDINRCLDNNHNQNDINNEIQQLPVNTSSIEYYDGCMDDLEERYESILVWKAQKLRQQQQQQSNYKNEDSSSSLKENQVQQQHNDDDNNNEGFTSWKGEKKAQKKLIKLHDKNESSWWVNDIDANHRVCGEVKCAFRSKTVHGKGYLVSLFQEDNKNFELAKHIVLFKDNWRMAKELESKFGVRHLNLEEPKLVRCSQENANRINIFATNVTKKLNITTTTNTTNNTNSNKKQNRKQQQQPKHKKIVIQPIQYMSSNSTILYKYSDDDNMELFQDDLVQFNQVHGSSDGTTLNIGYSEYKDQLRKDLDAAIKMVQHSERERSCLFWDFQVLFDVWRGRIYQLDLDRCAQKEYESPEEYEYYSVERIIPKLQTCYRLLLQWKKNQQEEINLAVVEAKEQDR